MLSNIIMMFSFTVAMIISCVFVVVRLRMKDVLRYAITAYGVPYVTTSGEHQMLESSAGNWDTLTI